MWYNIFKFELQYRKKRAATYIYFGILLLLCFLAVSTDAVRIGGAVGQVKENSPYVLTTMLLIISAFMTMIISAVMGVGVVRDFEHKTESLMFSTPIKKKDYLLGRFLGSFVTTLFIFSGSIFGLLLGDLMPWRETENMLPVSLWHYVQPFLLFVLPNIFIAGALFFSIGALSRRMLVVYTQGMFMLILYQVALTYVSDLDNKTFAALIDPFGLMAMEVQTEYWSIADKNTSLLSLSGLLLYNRLIWFSVAILSLITLYFGFNFNVVRGKGKAKKKAAAEATDFDRPIPLYRPVYSFAAQLKHLSRQTVFYFRLIVKDVPFLAIVLAGLGLTFASAGNMNTMYGTSTFPTTYNILEMLEGFNLFFLIIAIFYSGELIWKERSVKMNLIFDAMPTSTFVNLSAKFLSMMLVFCFLNLLLILSGVIIQVFKGYYDFELSLYFSSLFTDMLAFMALFTLLNFFIQSMLNHKFIGFAATIVFFIALQAIGEIGLEHRMFKYASATLGRYSDMNGYGHYIPSFSWFNVYWFGLASLMFGLAVLFSVRGTETLMKFRSRIAGQRLNPQLTSFIVICFLVFGGAGGFIYYNTNVVNTYQNSDDAKELRASYEKDLKQYEFAAQPKIIATQLHVDLYPENRDFTAEGTFILKNKSDKAIHEIHLQHPSDDQLTVEQVEFDRSAKVSDSFEDFHFYIYRLDEALQAGDSLQMDWKVRFETKGFEEGASNTSIVHNGSFFNNSQFFPSFGYSENWELSSDDDRRDHGFEPKERMLKRDDERGLSMNLFGDDADYIDFEVTVSTAPDQIAIAPGYLQREWKENGRRYFHYKMDQPMVNFYSIVSADYQVKEDQWISPKGKEVSLEIYYHKGHEYNLDRMMKGMKDALTYYSENFNEYQYRQMRIMEFPRYSSFAQSYANTVPFSEGIGFILDIQEEDVDMAYYVTAHEMAHQWWGHQVAEASVRGNAMLSETMSQYSALMVMKQNYSKEQMKEFLEHELDRYLGGRASESKKEMPLELVEGQGYIHYRKGAVVMFALQDYIGEERVNTALKNFLSDWYMPEGRYPTSADLIGYLRSETPDSLQYLITDMFEQITFYENKVEEAKVEQQGDDYLVNLKLESKKVKADSLGNETPVALRDWIDVGVYAENEEGEEELIYLKKHQITEETTQLQLKVNRKPVKAGIDPVNKLIDRHPDDNVKKVQEM